MTILISQSSAFALLSGAFLMGACMVTDEPKSTTQMREDSPLFAGVATYFDGHGSPYGGCGVPEHELDSMDFVALNVQNTPQEYTQYPSRPLNNQAIVGAWENGKNCGRWVRVSMGDYCNNPKGHGELGRGLCPEGQWTADEYNGRTLDMIVSDSCQDGNVWCRDSRHHLDMATGSLEKFGAGLSHKWGNRMVSWHFIEAPNYQGDIRIGFRQDAKPIWPAITVTHLSNGLSGIEQEVAGSFQALRMESDMGQSYILLPTSNQVYRIRLYDTQHQLVQGGRIYEFSFPCNGSCSEPFNEVKYTTQ